MEEIFHIYLLYVIDIYMALIQLPLLHGKMQIWLCKMLSDACCLQEYMEIRNVNKL